ncbi:MAG TPA: hypothetical protein VI564_08495 [Candidatus Nanoarchaeia archaeon]|nr:hypothetical protein [Candidatus Nanoarchaeia archaeon]
MRNKKGIEVQFNWLFVLLAGSAILIFFIVFIIRQKNVSEVSNMNSVLKSLESIIAGASVSTYTTNLIEIPESSIELGCNRLSIGKASRQYQNLILFGPEEIQGSRLITQTLDFNAPYRATNLLYITSRQLKYIIVGESDFAAQINRTLPNEINKDFYKILPLIKNENNYKVRFVFFESLEDIPASLQKMPDEDVTALKITGDMEIGTIEFFSKKKDSWLSKGTSSYLTKSSLIGAIYSDSVETYECNMQAAYAHLMLVNRVTADRVQEFLRSETYGRQAQCKAIYQLALTELRDIFESSRNMALKGISEEDTKSIHDVSKSLSAKNLEAKRYSCALVY